MAQEIELSVFDTIYEPCRPERKSRDTEHSDVTSTKRRLLRVGILTLGVLCVIQATLNMSLRLAFYSKEDTDQFPFNCSAIAELDQSQQNSCSCCNIQLRSLLQKYQAMKKERDRLHNMVTELSGDTTLSGSGSGSDLPKYFFLTEH